MRRLKGVVSYSALEEPLRIGVHQLVEENLRVVDRDDHKGWGKGS
jgi:hypothetical protein